jgi:hypothetical protein
MREVSSIVSWISKRSRLTISEDFIQTRWRIAIQLDAHDLIPANFPLFRQRETPKRRRSQCQGVKDIKNNVNTELNAGSLNAFSDCCVQLSKIHTVKEDAFHEK